MLRAVHSLIPALLLLQACNVVPRSQGNVLERPSSGLIEPANWGEIRFRSRGSDITFQNTGHFYVEPNSCHRRESGALDLATWNRIAAAINAAFSAFRSPAATAELIPPSFCSVAHSLARAR